MSKELQENQEFDLDDLEELELNLSVELLEGLKDLSFLEEERALIGNSESFAETIGNEILEKFQAQFNLEQTDETLIDKNARERYNKVEADQEKGITRVQEHEKIVDEKNGRVQYKQKDYNKEKAAEIQKNEKFVKRRSDLREEQTAGVLKDAYTGKDIKQSDKFDGEHVVSKSETYKDIRRQQTGIEAEDLANMEENIVATNPNLNRSKQDKSVEDYLASQEQRKEDLNRSRDQQTEKVMNSNMSDFEKEKAIEKINKSTDNKLAADEEKMRNEDKKARKAQKSKVNKKLTKEIGKDSLKKGFKTIVNSAVVEFMKQIMNALIKFLKSSKKSMKSFLESIKKGLTNFINKIRGIVESGAKNALGNIVSELFAPIVNIFKKLGKIIKQGVSSLVDVVKYLKKPESKSHTMAEKVEAISKIVIGGSSIIGAVALGEVFEKVLYSVPGMGFQLPFLGSLANIIGMFLSSVVVGIIGAIILNAINRWVNDSLKEEKNREILKKQAKLLTSQQNIQRTNIVKTEDLLSKAEQNIVDMHQTYELDILPEVHMELEKQSNRNYNIFD